MWGTYVCRWYAGLEGFKNYNSQSALEQLEQCIGEIRQWTKDIFLKLNDSKPEFAVLSSSKSNLVDVQSVRISEECVTAMSLARNIGAVIDRNLTMWDQVSNMCRNCYLSLHQIRPYLTEEAMATLVYALIISKLDCYNSFLIGVPGCLKEKKTSAYSEQCFSTYNKEQNVW